MIALALPPAGAVAPLSAVSFEDALVARRSGRSAEALAAFERLARANPMDADVWLNLGICYGDAHRYAEADRALETALTLAPLYADARLAYARMAYFRGRPAAARDRLQPLLAAEPENADAQQLSARIAAAQADHAPMWRVDFTYVRSVLTHGLDDWTLEAGTVSRSYGVRTVAALGAEHTRRFGKADTFVEAVVSQRMGATGEVHVAVGGADRPNYRARRALRGGGSNDVMARGQWRVRVGADLGWARYAVGDVTTLQPFMAATYRDRATLTVRSINTIDERRVYRPGYAVRLEGAVGPRLTMSGGWTDAAESSAGSTVKVRSASVGAVLALDADTGLRLDLTREVRTAYSRREMSISMFRRF